jgi:cytoskeletal protein CcmA (bactofilin family)
MKMAFKRRYKAPKVTTVIGQDTEITGDIRFRGGLHLDGKIIGNVQSEADTVSAITISDHGCVEGDIRVNSLVLNGTVVGDVYSTQRVELAAAARVTGTVYYHTLMMAPGAEVNGQLVHTDALSESVESGKELPTE